VFKQPQIKSKVDGVLRYNDIRIVPLEDGNNIVLNKNGNISILGPEGRELENHTVVIGAVISIKDGAKVKKGETFVQWDPYNVPILSEKAGKVKFHDVIEGVTMKQETDPTTQQEAMVVIEHKEDLHPSIVIVDDKGEPVANYPIPSGAHIVLNEGDKIVAGTLMAKTPRKTSKTKDITGGLPRVAELFEARRPKDASEIEDRRHHRLRRERARQALHRGQGRHDRHGRRTPHPDRQARHRVQGRLRAQRPAAHRRTDGSA
jgi:DNA-directed RNA polymerase subunit beta'